MKLPHGIKSALLHGKLRIGTSKTKKINAYVVEIAFFFGGRCILLPSSMADFVPCDGIMQRAHWHVI